MEPIINRLLDDVKVLHAQILEKERTYKKDDPYESTHINEIASSLSKAQGEYLPVIFNRDNLFFKNGYPDVHEVMMAVRPILSRNGLCVTQPTKIKENGEIILYTRLLHSSGQWMEDRIRLIPEKADIQDYGRTKLFLQRYALMGLLGITSSDDPLDDDAEGLMNDHRSLTPSPSHHYDPKKQSPTTITKEQVEELEMELDGFPDLAKAFLHAMKISALCDLPKSMYHDARHKILERKKTLTNPLSK